MTLNALASCLESIKSGQEQYLSPTCLSGELSNQREVGNLWAFRADRTGFLTGGMQLVGSGGSTLCSDQIGGEEERY